MNKFDRRDFIQLGAAALAVGAMTPSSFAQVEAATAMGKKMKVDCNSKYLQWLGSADDVAKGAIDMGYDGVDIAIRPAGLVDPANVATQLPALVKTLRQHGLQVTEMTCPITDADSPNAEAILQAGSTAGLTHFSWGSFHYDSTKAITEQLDALKPRMEKIATLGKRYNMKAMYRPAGEGAIGYAMWDILSVLKNFDPAHVGIHYDLGEMTNAGGNGTWQFNLCAAGPYIAGVSVRDFIYEANIPISGGGPFTGPPAPPRAPGGGGFGGPGASGGAAGFGGLNGPAGPEGAPGGPGGPDGPGAAAGGGPAAGGAAAGRGGRGGGGAPGAPGAPGAAGAAGGRGGAAAGGGRGAGGAAAAARPPDPRGGDGQPEPWKPRPVLLGTGLDNLPMFATLLKQINFDGPLEILSDYPNGGAETGQSTVTLSRAIVLGSMKRDLLTLKAGFKASGLL